MRKANKGEQKANFKKGGIRKPRKESFSRDRACSTMPIAIKWSSDKETKVEITNLKVISHFFPEICQQHDKNVSYIEVD